MSNDTTWVKALGIGAFALGAVGVIALVANSSGGAGGTVPPDEIEDDDVDDGDDDGIPVEAETIPGVFQK